MNKLRSLAPITLMPLVALLLTIPAFYLILAGPSDVYRVWGRALYALTAFVLLMHMVSRKPAPAGGEQTGGKALPGKSALDHVILLGAIASIWPTTLPWNSIEWLLRLGYCGVVFIRLPGLLIEHVALNRLSQIALLAACMLAIAGAGFWWLEPNVSSYADGVWLAFTTGATVGYGDLVPSTPASRVFASFIVLLGYALFSLLTANIAALLVGEDEKRLRHEMHADMRLLRREIAGLRTELAHGAASGRAFSHAANDARVDASS